MNELIARYVDGLTEEQEDRLLTGRLGPGNFWEQDGVQCLVGRALGVGVWGGMFQTRATPSEDAAWKAYSEVAWSFDGECTQRGTATVAAEIRQRILDNRAARMPAPQPTESPELVHALAHPERAMVAA